jgi:geranyl-CoA carboxylase alpha subunit
MSSRFDSVLVANRGEIACRVIRAARVEGLRAIAVFSDADADAPHARLADLAVRIGPAPPSRSYLVGANIIAAAKAAGAGAIHPGYGFLSENADFAQSVIDAGLVFIGPSPSAMRAMGDKSAAKSRMVEAGVPCARGYHGEDQSFARFADEAERIGYPVMIKASAGGGGRGMRIVSDAADLEPALRAASAEAGNAFGDGRLLLERALIGARHVEVQVFGDEFGSMVHLGERDCSIQRRHQKIIEESPSPAVSPELRARMGEAAVRAASAVGYVGAGTVEFLLDGAGRFYFLEMNTRIQVEHPVTEMVTGLDLVRLQFSVAQGLPLPLRQADVRWRGHAIEARLCAEDARADFMPAAGDIVAWRPGGGEGVRVDHGLAEGGAVSPYYDSLLAKVIAHGEDREQARLRLIAALKATMLAGVVTNRDFLVEALRRPAFIEGAATTTFIAETPPSVAGAPPPEALALAALLFAENGGVAAPSTPWRRTPLVLESDSGTVALAIRRDRDAWSATIGDETTTLRLLGRDAGRIRYARGDTVAAADYARWGDRLKLDIDGVGYDFVDRTYAPPRLDDDAADGGVRSPVSGVLVGVDARVGDHVKRGQALATVEAMKMQYVILAPIDGMIAAAPSAAGVQVSLRGLLFEINPTGGASR